MSSQSDRPVTQFDVNGLRGEAFSQTTVSPPRPTGTTKDPKNRTQSSLLNERKPIVQQEPSRRVIRGPLKDLVLTRVVESSIRGDRRQGKPHRR
jgi:hypothetical protein